MFADTLTITINSVAKVLTRINQDKYSSEYFLRESDGEFRMRIRNTSYNNKAGGNGGIVTDRHNVEFTQTIYAVAPVTSNTVRKIYTVLENQQGDGLAAIAKFAVGFLAFETEANITKMLNWES